MEKQWYLVSMKDMDKEAEFVSLCLNRATAFRAYFPDDSELGGRKGVFVTLPNASVAAWEGMDGCVVVSAPLDFVSREIFRSWMTATEERKPLWQYELLEHDDVFFRAEDFFLYMVLASRTEVQEFQQQGIDTSMWHPIDLRGQEGVATEPWSDEEIRQLREDLGPKE